MSDLSEKEFDLLIVFATLGIEPHNPGERFTREDVPELVASLKAKGMIEQRWCLSEKARQIAREHIGKPDENPS